MFRKLSFIALLAPLAMVACSEDNPVAPGATQFDVTFQTPASHTHIWETRVPYTALIKNPATQGVVTGFDTMRVEFAAVGTTTWAKLGDLRERPSGSYVDTLYWGSAGDFNYRLVGHRVGQNGVQVLAAPSTVISPVRQHYNVAGTTWRVEFEPVPGFNKPGDTPTMNFYVMEATANPDGSRTPISGLTGVTITCVSPASASTMKTAAEKAGTPGLYQATCTVPANGWWKATVSLPVSGGPAATQEAEYGVGAISGT